MLASLRKHSSQSNFFDSIPVRLAGLSATRRLFPGVIDNTKARECAWTIAGWQPLPATACQVTRLGLGRRGRDRSRACRSPHGVPIMNDELPPATARMNASNSLTRTGAIGLGAFWVVDAVRGNHSGGRANAWGGFTNAVPWHCAIGLQGHQATDLVPLLVYAVRGGLIRGCDNEYWPTCADEYWPTPRCLIC
jgi:hypothetical protein